MTLHHRSENCRLVDRPLSKCHWRDPSIRKIATYPFARRTDQTRLCALSETQGFHQREASFHVYGGTRKLLKMSLFALRRTTKSITITTPAPKLTTADMASRS